MTADDEQARAQRERRFASPVRQARHDAIKTAFPSDILASISVHQRFQPNRWLSQPRLAPGAHNLMVTRVSLPTHESVRAGSIYPCLANTIRKKPTTRMASLPRGSLALHGGPLLTRGDLPRF